MVPSTVNLKYWIEEHRHLLKPPVGNKMIWPDGDYIVMVVGGPNSRKDYHYNETPEFFQQIEGDITLKVMENGEQRDVLIKEGEIFLLPGGVSHSPQRPENTIGMVIEYPRKKGMMDALEWYCENCGNQLYREEFQLKNLESDMPAIFDRFYSSKELRTCDHCGEVMEPPKPVLAEN